MNEIHYYLLNPTKNYTVLVETPVKKALQPFVTSMIMKAEPLAEQVGFFEILPDGNISMNMAGGEFCGNATMSAAVLSCILKNEYPKKVKNVIVEYPDLSKKYSTSVLFENDKTFIGKVEMPEPIDISNKSLKYNNVNYNLYVITFLGMSHIIFDSFIEKDDAEKAIKIWCRELSADALGIMIFDHEKMFMRPLVYVPKADTLFWENSCASGTTAVGYYLLQKKCLQNDIKIYQPGGELNVSFVSDSKISLSGKVSLIKDNVIKAKING